MGLAAALLLAVLAASLLYCVIVVLATRHYLAERISQPRPGIPISVLKPLHGLDEGLEDNLRTFFEQDYPAFEILFAVRREDDPALEVVERLHREFPGIPARLIVTGEPPYPNAKVFSLDRMLAEARFDILVMSDSDIRAPRGLLARIAAEFRDERVGLAVCPYRAAPGRSFWSRLEALGMNTEFWGGVAVARLLEGMKFGVGPTMAVRRHALHRIGGFDRLSSYLAEDFVMGRLIAEAGYKVILSSQVVEHRIGSQSLRVNFAHRLRWARSTRRSRPAGYIGQAFTYPIVLALLVVPLAPKGWVWLLAALALRALAAWSVAGPMLHDGHTGRYWWALPLQDLLAFGFWIAGFFGKTIVWRGRRYFLLRDGRFQPVASASARGAGA
jgi:ceramide glucosyltransferase